jgi:hypothetical protein
VDGEGAAAFFARAVLVAGATKSNSGADAATFLVAFLAATFFVGFLVAATLGVTAFEATFLVAVFLAAVALVATFSVTFLAATFFVARLRVGVPSLSVPDDVGAAVSCFF